LTDWPLQTGTRIGFLSF